jgi:uncharacterized protein (TIGR02145 family)
MLLRAFCAVSFFVFACSGGGSSSVTHGDETYETVVIGEQIWFKRNLNYVPVDTNAATNYKCYEDNDYNCEEYGRLYDWATTMALPDSCNSISCASQIETPPRGICPVGYHVPTNADWDILARYVDGSTSTDSPYNSATAGKYLKAKIGWEHNNGVSGNGEDTYSFSALPSGISYPDGNFYSIGNSGYWWSANEINNNNAFRRSIHYDSEGISYFSFGKNLFFSVRCIGD